VNHRGRTVGLFLALMSVLVLTLGSPVLSVKGEDGTSSLQADHRPSPDPTILTTQNLQREIAALKEVVNTRIDAMDKAVLLLQQRADRVPSEVDLKTSALKELMIEKFKSFDVQIDGIVTGMQLQFKERDVRTSQTSEADKTAVNAALKAQQESVEKQNTAFSLAAQKQSDSFTKQLDLLVSTVSEIRKGLEDKITSGTKVNDDKIGLIDARITRIESMAQGLSLAKTDQSKDTTLIISLVALVLTIIGVATAVLVANRRQLPHS
jgi:hypothetical protein